MNLGVKPQTQEGVVECFFVSDVTTQKWGGLGIGGRLAAAEDAARWAPT